MTNLPAAENAHPLSKSTVSFGIALAITSVASALLVVAKETHQATVMAWMKRASGHHWATHSLLAVILFFALGLILSRARGGQGVQLSAPSLVKVIVLGIALGGLIIGGFYLAGE